MRTNGHFVGRYYLEHGCSYIFDFTEMKPIVIKDMDVSLEENVILTDVGFILNDFIVESFGLVKEIINYKVSFIFHTRIGDLLPIYECSFLHQAGPNEFHSYFNDKEIISN